MDALSRYSVIHDKNPREIVLLRGSGCRWRRCRFCDYHMDRSDDVATNVLLNRSVLHHVTGMTGVLEVINSGSFSDLPATTLEEILLRCKDHAIDRLHVECHWIDRNHIKEFRERCRKNGIQLKVKTGVETFDGTYREQILDKGLPASVAPASLREFFDECCLLMGLSGQTLTSMVQDVAIGLKHFERICINVFCPNDSAMTRDDDVVDLFMKDLYPIVKDHPRVDVLIENTDFGVG